jgi:hypothetical protein
MHIISVRRPDEDKTQLVLQDEPLMAHLIWEHQLLFRSCTNLLRYMDDRSLERMVSSTSSNAAQWRSNYVDPDLGVRPRGDRRS